MTTLQTHQAPAAAGPPAARRAGLPFRPHVVAAVFGRDFLGFFTNPAGYVFVTLFLIVGSCAQFWQPAFFANNLANLEPLNRWMPFILLIFIPAITMSMWAEERKQGTDELLLTLPARDVEVVLGKFKAAVGIATVALLFLALGCALIFAGVKFGPLKLGALNLPELSIGGLGRPDQGVFVATFLGYWLMALMMIAIGMVASILSSNVTVAYILGGLACALPVFAGSLSRDAVVNALALVLCLAGLAFLVSGLRLVGRAAAEGSTNPTIRASLQRRGLLAGVVVGPLLILLGLLLYPGIPLLGLDQSVPRAVGTLFERMSIPAQFRDFGSGMIRLTGVLYFLAMTGAMLYLNMVLLGRRHWAGGQASTGRWGHALVRVAAVVVGLISLVTLVGRFGDGRVDATEERLHTLSPITAKLAREIPGERPVYIQAYVSPEVPREFVETRANLLNTLRELAAIGGDKVRLNVIETRRYSAEAREAEKRFGINARRVPTSRDGQQTVEEIYLGVAFTSGLEQVVIPFFDRGLPVEYELARSIRVAGGTRRRRVGILETEARLLGGVDFRSQGQEPEWAIVTELKKQYDVQPVSPSTPIPFEEEQSIALSGEPTGGAFTLKFGDETTAPIAFDATPQAVSDALVGLKGLGGGAVQVSGGPLPKTPIRVRFTGKFTGQDVPELVVGSETLTGGEKPRAKVATTAQVLEALVVAQPTTLTPPQVERLVEYVRKGGPTLLLMDPAPVMNLAIAPQILRMPTGAVPPPPEGALDPLLQAIGIEWPDTQIVWNAYNPHQQFEMPMEYVVVGAGNGAKAPFADDPTTSKLQEVFLLFPGFVRERPGADGPKWTPLLTTGDQGGTLRFDEAIELGPLGMMSRLRPNRPHFASGRPFTLAARIGGRPAPLPTPNDGPAPVAPTPPAELKVIAIADLDLISDPIFELRRKLVEAYDDLEFDNVTFVLNCVDALAGDETFIELRKKRPKHRTLTALEAESIKFVEQSQAEQRKAEETANEQLEQARTRLREAVEKIRNSTELDQRTKESMVRYREQVEQRRLTLIEQEIQDRKAQAIRESKDRQEEAIRAIQHRIGAQAAVLTPLPALLLGGLVFFIRNRRENQGANPDRLA